MTLVELEGNKAEKDQARRDAGMKLDEVSGECTRKIGTLPITLQYMCYYITLYIL